MIRLFGHIWEESLQVAMAQGQKDTGTEGQNDTGTEGHGQKDRMTQGHKDTGT